MDIRFEFEKQQFIYELKVHTNCNINENVVKTNTDIKTVIQYTILLIMKIFNTGYNNLVYLWLNSTILMN